MYLVKLEEFSIQKFDDILMFLGRTDWKTQRMPELNRNRGYEKGKEKQQSLSVVKCSRVRDVM
jgi:hypothetical protein